ncbi:MAG: serine/threonine-protein kinase [Anaerolineae bacterium]
MNLIQPGEVVGPYRVVRGFRSHGGMAQVCEVEVRKKYRSPDIPERLALKVADEQHQAALVAEADYLRRFEHPNVIRIYPLPGYHRPVYAAKERFAFGWRWYYAMELLSGGSLEQRLTRPTTMPGFFRRSHGLERPLPLVQVIGIAHQMAAALAHIHRRSVINLDLKPANILFRRRRMSFLRSSVPQAVLSDFGIARDPQHPRFGQLGMATWEYVSPEHAREIAGERAVLDQRSDIFSLGVVLYEMLTGQLPFEDLSQVLAPDYIPVPPRHYRRSVPGDLESVVMRAMSKYPYYRFQTADEMLAALKQLGRRLDWPATIRRTATAALVAAGLAAGGYGAWRMVDDDVPPPTATAPAAEAPVGATTASVASEVSPSPTVAPSETPTAFATSTPRPTSTATPTPRPTPTPTSTPVRTLAPTLTPSR